MINEEDRPLFEIAEEIEALFEADSNVSVFQKFTCECCGSRQTMDRPNVLYTTGRCDECKHITDIFANGCGFMMVSSADPVAHREFVNFLSRSIASSQPRNRN